MSQKPKTPRLKKGPDICDYVAEEIFTGRGFAYKYFITRKDAREYAKTSTANRIRVFHLKATLVLDKKK